MDYYYTTEELYGDFEFSESIDTYKLPEGVKLTKSIKNSYDDIKTPYRPKTGIVEHIKNHNMKLEKN